MIMNDGHRRAPVDRDPKWPIDLVKIARAEAKFTPFDCSAPRIAVNGKIAAEICSLPRHPLGV
jgi:hypothetical protein